MAKDFYSPWYSYGVFRFTREQIIWAIDHRVFFDKENKWPPEPSEYETDKFDKESGKWTKVIVKSSYVDTQGQRQFKPDAPFINSATIWGEISRRLELTKTDGKLLIKEIESMERPNYEGLEYSESQSALNYISLWDFRKRPPYVQWKKQGTYYRRKISTER